MHTTTTDGQPEVAAIARKPILSEDWVIVVLGFLIIFQTLFLYAFPVPSFSWGNIDTLVGKVLSASNLGALLGQMGCTYVVGAMAMALLRKPLGAFLKTFPLVALLTAVALVLAGHEAAKGLNLEAVIFSLSIGLLVGNTLSLPQWLKDSLQAELFVKIGLVLLGTGIIFGDILQAGALGLLQSLVVVISVWHFAFWVCKRLGLDEELGLMLSSAVSICGVSAAIATSGAIKGDNKKLSYVISLVLVTAIPMMIFMPYMAQWLGLSQAVTGAWLGGSIDTTGAVVASGTLVGEEALKVSSIVKFSQNVLLGIAAFAISVYWTYRQPQGQTVEKPTLGMIWARFPKFVLGFVAASLLFSFLLTPEQIVPVKGSLKSLQTLWFVLAFTSIGLETRFSDLIHRDNRKPLYAFLLAQGFNVLVTLAMAILLFGA